MHIGVLGTGMVGRALAGRLDELGHDVVVGTRDPYATLVRTAPDAMGNQPFSVWQRQHRAVELVPLAQAGAHGDLLVNATAGAASVAALAAAGVDGRDGVVILDVANPLDYSAGFPPALTVSNTDSLAEQIQRLFPRARVVKSLNTVNARVMIDPARVPGDHSVFVAGDDVVAKRLVIDLLGQFGWADTNIVDLGGIRAARGTEMYLPLWLLLMQTLQTSEFNINVVKA